MPKFTRADIAALQQELREHAQAAAQKTTTHETIANNLHGMAERLNVHLPPEPETVEPVVAPEEVPEPQERQEPQALQAQAQAIEETATA